MGVSIGEFDEIVSELGLERSDDFFEQFRREIGKYVDENEVARLARYIEIR